MTTATNVSTYTGRYTAQQRANDAWNLTELPADEEARHQKLMKAIRRIETKVSEGQAETPRDPYRWRRGWLRLNGGRCTNCFGKGWVQASRYAHVDDFIECPVCGPLRPRKALAHDDAFPT